tara:strand:- start:746 stop:1567 length:822 start_codon:yes stop_codon:yes gene_type:complete
MKKIILTVGLLVSQIVNSQCDYTNTMPSVVGATKKVCFTQDEIITHGSIVNYGEIIINDGVEVQFNGALQNYGSGNFKLMGCDSKITSTTFGGVWLNVDIERYCGSCVDTYINSAVAVDKGYFKTAGAVSFTNVGCQAPLPIELISFKAYGVKKGINAITWTTAMQLNNWYFEVEKSRDGDEWDVLIRVDGEDGIEVMTYFVNDVVSGVCYYRLKQVDFNQTETFSNVVIVNKSNFKKKIIQKVNFLGQEVSDDYKGIVIIIYDDQTRKITKQ